MDNIILGLFAVFGLIIIIGYIKLALEQKNLWNVYNKNIEKTLKNFYILMICLATVACVYLIYFYTVKEGLHKPLLYSGVSIFLIASAFWALFPKTCPKISLFLVSVGALLMLITNIMHLEQNNTDVHPKLAVAAAVFIFIHVFVFDFIIWTYKS